MWPLRKPIKKIPEFECDVIVNIRITISALNEIEAENKVYNALSLLYPNADIDIDTIYEV